MRKIHIAFLFIILICTVFFTGCKENSNLSNTDTEDNNAVNNKYLAKVNGDYLLKNEIDEVYQLYDSTVSYKKILEDSIFELIVLQQSKLYGIRVSDEEVNNILEQYQETQPGYYSQAIELYGKDRLKEKLRNKNLYNKTKDYVCTNIISNQDTITDGEYNKFLDAYNLNEYLSQFEKSFVIKNQWDEIQEFLFRTWVNELKAESSITIFDYINKDDVNINKIDSDSSFRIDAKVKEVSLENWDFTFISETEIPFKLKSTNYYEIYVQPPHVKKEGRDKTEYSQLAHYRIEYQGEHDKNIFVNFSEKAMPIRDYGSLSMKYSFVQNAEVMIAEYENLYIIQFAKDNLNFDIEFQNISEQDMLVILHSILQ